DPVGTIEVRGKPRISGGVDPERLIEAYTKQGTDEIWAFVFLDDVIASKTRAISSDAVDNLRAANFYRQQITEVFTVLFLVPATNEHAALNARDVVQGDLFLPVGQSLLGHRFNTNLTVEDQGSVVFVTGGRFFSNALTPAVYAHGFTYQQTSDIGFCDTVGPERSARFNDLNFSLAPSHGTKLASGTMTAGIDLDEEPL
ncbi:unnamed protein product, partial [marine sediment metagenome]